jgi:hypothetical protein
MRVRMMAVAVVALAATTACGGDHESAAPKTPAPTPTATTQLAVPSAAGDLADVCAKKRIFADAPAYAGKGPHQLLLIGLVEAQQPWNFGALKEIQLAACAQRTGGPKIDNCFYSGDTPVQNLVRGDVKIRLVELRTGRDVATVKAAGKPKATCKTILMGYEAKQKIQYGPLDDEAIYAALRPYYMADR